MNFCETFAGSIIIIMPTVSFIVQQFSILFFSENTTSYVLPIKSGNLFVNFDLKHTALKSLQTTLNQQVKNVNN